MSVHLNPTKQVEARLGIEKDGRVQSFFTETCYKAMDKYVPRSAGTDGGSLRDTVDIQTDSITYQSVYAGYQYYGQRKDGTRKIQNWTTPGTGPYWNKRMWSVDKDKVLRQVEKKIRSGV